MNHGQAPEPLELRLQELHKQVMVEQRANRKSQQEAEMLREQLGDMHLCLTKATQALEAKEKVLTEKNRLIELLRSKLAHMCIVSTDLRDLVLSASAELTQRAPLPSAAAYAAAGTGAISNRQARRSGSGATARQPPAAPAFDCTQLTHGTDTPTSAAWPTTVKAAAPHTGARPFHGGSGNCAPWPAPGSGWSVGHAVLGAKRPRAGSSCSPEPDSRSGATGLDCFAAGDGADVATLAEAAAVASAAAVGAPARWLQHMHSGGASCSPRGSDDAPTAIAGHAPPELGGWPLKHQRSITGGESTHHAAVAEVGSGGLVAAAAAAAEEVASDDAADSLLRLAVVAARHAEHQSHWQRGRAARAGGGSSDGGATDSDAADSGGGPSKGWTPTSHRRGTAGAPHHAPAPTGRALDRSDATRRLAASSHTAAGVGTSGFTSYLQQHGTAAAMAPPPPVAAHLQPRAAPSGTASAAGDTRGRRPSWFQSEVNEKIPAAVRDAVAAEWRSQGCIAVVCADLHGDVFIGPGGELAMRITGTGDVVSPNKFEEMAGKKTARNWQQSIRLAAYTMTGEPSSALLKLGHFTRIVGLATDRN